MKHFTFLIIVFISTLAVAYPHSKDSISFDYKFEKIDNIKGAYWVNAEIINHSSQHFYFLSESCNGLDYYISSTSPKVVVYILINCNATFPRKNSIAPNETYAFKFRIKSSGDVTRVGLNLSLVKLSKSYSVKDKSIGVIRQKMRVINLSGPVLPLPN